MKIALSIAGLILTITLIIAVPSYLQDVRAGEEKLSAYQTSTIATPIVPVEYYRTGQGEPLLISHGITGGFDQGLGLAESYIGSGFDLIAVSRLGYLGTPLPKNASPDIQAEVYKDLLDKLNIEKTYVFGTSAGATSAIKFAMMYPERCSGLILVSSNVPSDVKMPPRLVMQSVFGSDFIFWSAVKIGRYNMLPIAGVPAAIITNLSRPEKQSLLNNTVMSGFPVSSRTKGIINDMYVSNPDINNNYAFEQISVPVLMIHAKDDPLCSYEGALVVAERIPDIKLVSFEQGGHLILGNEKVVQQEIAAFIK